MSQGTFLIPSFWKRKSITLDRDKVGQSGVTILLSLESKRTEETKKKKKEKSQ